MHLPDTVMLKMVADVRKGDLSCFLLSGLEYVFFWNGAGKPIFLPVKGWCAQHYGT